MIKNIYEPLLSILICSFIIKSNYRFIYFNQVLCVIQKKNYIKK